MTTYNPTLVARYDVSSYRPVSLEKIVKEVYGTPYNENYSIEEIHNDTTYDFSLLTEAECTRILSDDEEWGNDVYKFSTWLASPNPEMPPAPQVVLSDLILKGHLPYGVYILNICW